MKKSICMMLLLTFWVTPIVAPQSWFDKAKDKVGKYIDKGKEKVREIYNNNKEKVKEKTKEVIKNSSSNIKNFNNNHRETYNRIFNKTEQITNDIKNDPRKIFQYKKQADKMIQGAVIIGVKNIPIYDPHTGQVISFDNYCWGFVNEVGGSAIHGSEFQEDPVGLAVMVMMDHDYLLEAKIITTPEGEWISANDALNSNLDKYGVQLLHSDYAEMKNAYESGDINYFNQKLQDFRVDAANLSNYCAYSCPWVYLYNGEKFIKYDEIIKDQNSESLDLYQSLNIPQEYVLDNELTILISEELDEISYLDNIYLFVGDRQITPVCSGQIFNLLSSADNNYLILNSGESILLRFTLDKAKQNRDNIKLNVKGYYKDYTELSKAN